MKDDNNTEVGRNATGGKEYKLDASVGYPAGTKQQVIDMNAIVKLAVDHGFVRPEVSFSMGNAGQKMSTNIWQKDVLEASFWEALAIPCNWRKDIARDFHGLHFLEMVLKTGWDNAVDYLMLLIKQSNGHPL